MKYSHTLTVTRPSDSGSLNSMTGIFTPSGSDTSVYSGKVDAQEVSNRDGKEYKGSELKTQQTMLDVYLKDESNITGFAIGDSGSLVRNGVTRDVSITKIREIDGVLEAVVL